MDVDLHPAAVRFGEIEYEPGGRFGPRLQRDLQFVFVEVGEARVSVDGEWDSIGEGMVAALKPGREEFFQFAIERRTRHSWCAITLGRGATGERRFVETLPFSVPADDCLRRLFALGVDQGLGGGSREEALRIKLGGAVVAAFLRAAGGGDPASVLPVPVSRVYEAIRRDYAQPADLEALGRIAGVTPSHLIRLFRKHLGVTPIRFLWQVRFREGMRLLRESGLSVSEVAFRCGFQNPFHFSRLVKEECGLSPRAYRLRVWEGK